MRTMMMQNGMALALVSAVIVAVAGACMLLTVMMHGCTPQAQQRAQTVVEMLPGTCLRIATIWANGEVQRVCATAEELAALLPVAGVQVTLDAGPAYDMACPVPQPDAH